MVLMRLRRNYITEIAFKMFIHKITISQVPSGLLVGRT